MKIISLEVSNVLKIDAIFIEANGKNITLSGANASGKTSVLRAIAMAMGGKDEIPDEVIHKGAKKAHIDLDLGEFKIRRTFTAAGGGALTVTAKDGTKYSSPQAVLDGLVGQLTFDPLAFTRLKADKQAETLRNLVGLDFSEMDAEAKKVRDERTILNREINQKEAACVGIATYPNMPDKEVEIEDVVKRLRVAEEHNRKRDVLASQATDTNSKAEVAESSLKHMRETMKELLARMEDGKLKIAAQEKVVFELNENADRASVQLDAFKPMPVDDFVGQIANLQETNRKVRANLERRTKEQAVRALVKQADALTDTLEKLACEKRELLESARMPVSGLSFTDAGVLYNGLPFDQASAAEQLRVSAAMAVAMNPKLKVILIRDGSLLDDDSLAILREIAGEETQLWVEKVAANKEMQVIIEEAA